MGIGNNAFASCKNLKTIELPYSVKRIEVTGFYDCENLIQVDLPNSIEYIDNHAFADCISLKSIEIPSSVEWLGWNPFAGCSNLESFYGKFASEDHRSLICGEHFNSLAPYGLTEFTVPNTVITINFYAFNKCSELKRIVFPETVQKVGWYAFVGCENLAEIVSLNPIPPIADFWTFFKLDTEKVTIKVPAKALDDYEEAEGWKDFFNIVGLSDEEIAAVDVKEVQDADFGTQESFDLSGRRVGEDYKGIVIRGGRKILKR